MHLILLRLVLLTWPPVVPQPLVVEYKFANRLRELVVLPRTMPPTEPGADDRRP